MQVITLISPKIPYRPLRQKILDAVNSGKHVIIDRYAYSGVAYSAAKV